MNQTNVALSESAGLFDTKPTIPQFRLRKEVEVGGWKWTGRDLSLRLGKTDE